MGVIEHTFSIPDPPRPNVDWKIYDVGGARNQRHAWAPYFEDGKLCKHDPYLLILSTISERDHIFGTNLGIRSGPCRGVVKRLRMVFLPLTVPYL